VGHPGSPTIRKHVMYVWFDALTNYLTVLGFGSGETARTDRYWPAVTHLVGQGDRPAARVCTGRRS
jgi:methionyl-tRNA synthetase